MVMKRKPISGSSTVFAFSQCRGVQNSHCQSITVTIDMSPLERPGPDNSGKTEMSVVSCLRVTLSLGEPTPCDRSP